jgi:hypothetical protein
MNALWGILIFAVDIFLTGFPVAYYSARCNIDLDLVTRGSGFGYYGSVGFGSMLIAAGVSVIAFFGGLGEAIRPYSPLVAIGLAVVLPPVLAIATTGKYYLRRTDDGIDLPMYDEFGNPSGEHLKCHVCHHDYERANDEVRDPRCARVLVVPEHRQAG